MNDTSPALLHGRTIALPETRELDRMATLLEDEGATTLRCPLVAILDTPDTAPVDDWLARLAAGGFDDVIFLTGEGLRRLVARAERLHTREAVVAALGRVRKLTRGPKPARALHELGLATDIAARTPTSQGVIDSLRGETLAGRRIGVQLYGSDPNRPLIDFLRGAGADVFPVAPYVYAPAADEERVLAVIEEMVAGRVDAVAFTSASQVDRLFAVAETRGCLPRLREGLGRTRIAAVGPIVAESLSDRGLVPQIAPEAPFVMKRLVNALRDALVPPPG